MKTQTNAVVASIKAQGGQTSAKRVTVKVVKKNAATVKGGAKAALLATVKTAKAVVAKAVKTVKAAFNGDSFAETTQVYRAFKRIDVASYKAQGELTICALRKGLVAQLDKAAASLGSDFVVMSCEYGIACISGTVGKTADGVNYIASGKFALGLDNQKVVFRGNYKAFVAWVRKTGEGQGTYRGGKTFTHAIGSGAHYGIGIAGGKVTRLESATCERGKNWFYALDGAGKGEDDGE